MYEYLILFIKFLYMYIESGVIYICCIVCLSISHILEVDIDYLILAVWAYGMYLVVMSIREAIHGCACE
jgi:hypothetical protein